MGSSCWSPGHSSNRKLESSQGKKEVDGWNKRSRFRAMRRSLLFFLDTENEELNSLSKVEKKIRTGGKKVKGGGMGKKAMLVLLQSSNQISKISKSIRKNT